MSRSLVVILAALLSSPAVADHIPSSVDGEALSAGAKTKLGYYVTSQDAYRALADDPSIVFVDVRTEAEFHYVGHAKDADMNLPWQTLKTGPVYNGKGAYELEPNPDFAAAMDALMAREGKSTADTVFLICRSGSRSAKAVDFLTERGFSHVYNVVDGFEGGKDKQTGHRTVEGWRNADLPWDYTVTETQAYRGAR